MKDKYNNFQIAFDSENELKDFYDTYIVDKFDEVDFNLVKSITNQIQLIDQKMEGRFGGSVKDLLIVAIVRYVSSKSLEIKNNSAHVEIGTLFGGTALLTSFILKNLGLENDIKNIMIDPLAGYYGNKIDFISQLEVTRERLEQNLKTFHVKNYKVYQNYSTDWTLIDQVSNYHIHSLFIDGDHSFSGLLKDWNNFNSLMPIGSYILIDNVNDKNWPNINIFIELLKDSIDDVWEIIYEENITLVLRKKTNKSVIVDTKIDLDLVHKIEYQVDAKFYKSLDSRNKKIQNLRRWLDKEKEEKANIRRWLEKEKEEKVNIRRWLEKEKEEKANIRRWLEKEKEEKANIRRWLEKEKVKIKHLLDLYDKFVNSFFFEKYQNIKKLLDFIKGLK